MSLTLVDNGLPTSTIVVAKDPTIPAAFAAVELQSHFQKITGGTVPIVTDDMPVVGTPILVGESGATRALGYENADFGPQEYRLDFEADSLMLMGHDSGEKTDTGYTLAYGNPSWIADGRYGNALRFDGDDMVNAYASSISEGFNDDSGTLEAWVRFTSVSGDPSSWILNTLSPTGDYHSLTRTSSNQVRYLVYTPSQGYCQVISSSLSPNVWYHVSATHDVAAGGKIELFINGQSQGVDGYVATRCEGWPLNIGAYSPGGGIVAYGYHGDLDEVRASASVRNGAAAYQEALGHAPFSDTGTLLLTHLDSTSGAPLMAYIPSLLNEDNVALPGTVTEQATCYAVYDFLEDYCGVRWFNPTETGTYCPSSSNLVITDGVDMQRSPNMPMRCVSYAVAGYDAGNQTLYTYGSQGWSNYVDAAHPGMTEAERNRATNYFLRRMRDGGDWHQCTHSLEGYYSLYRTTHPDWFVNPNDPSSQLVYSHPGVIGQVAADAAAYYNSHAGEEDVAPFMVESMDNGVYAPGDKYSVNNLYGWTDNTSGFFSNGSASNYLFHFVNQVAATLHHMPGHENDKVITLAYFTHAAPPTNVNLDPSVEVQFCFAENRMVYDAGYNHELSYLQAWKTEQQMVSGRTLSMWLYPLWPWTYATDPAYGQNFNIFPGYYAHALADEFEQFGSSYRGIYWLGWGQEVESYVTLKLMDDPTQDVDVLLNDYFTTMYGPAAAPMQAFYNLVEDTYSNPANYPPGLAVGQDPEPHHQTEAIAWGWLGTSERMVQLQTYMTQATTAAGSDNIYATNVNLFRLGTWEYMLEGRLAYLNTYNPPTSTISSPSNGTVASTSASVTIVASAQDNGSVSKVQFYADGNLIGTDTYRWNGWSYTWSSPTPGVHHLMTVATDNSGNQTPSAFVTYTVGVQVNQASGQTDPTSAAPINFTVVFSTPVSDFATGDVSFSGSTAPGTLVGVVTNPSSDRKTYNVAVSGMTGAGTVIASLAAGVAHDAAGRPSAPSISTDSVVAYAPTQVVGRYTFYNNCKWDGHTGFTNGDPAANAWDDSAIATDKNALLPGATGSFVNYTSYLKGLNGVMVDISGLAGRTLSAADFQFKVGNTSDPSSWTAAPTPTSVTVRVGEGVGGSDRVTIIWADNAIQKQWLQVTVLANGNTGLTAADVFYWGNQIGETGNNPANTRVDALDTSGIQAHYSALSTVSIANPYDINRDKYVNAIDFSAAQARYTGLGTTLIVLTAPEGLEAVSGFSLLLSVAAGEIADAITTPTATATSSPQSLVAASSSPTLSLFVIRELTNARVLATAFPAVRRLDGGAFESVDRVDVVLRAGIDVPSESNRLRAGRRHIDTLMTAVGDGGALLPRVGEHDAGLGSAFDWDTLRQGRFAKMRVANAIDACFAGKS